MMQHNKCHDTPSIERALFRLAQWYHHTPGKQIGKEECSTLYRMLLACPVQHLLQIGGPQQADLFDTFSDIEHVVYCGPQDSTNFLGPVIQSDPCLLPVKPGSIHMVILWHILELMPEMNDILNEVVQALQPEGYLMILSFNANSLWGLRKRLANRSVLPWCHRFYTISQLKHQLTLHHLNIVKAQTLFFKCPWRLSSRQHVLGRGSIHGLWGLLGGAVCLVLAQKRQPAMIPLRHQQSVESSFLPRHGIEPVTHQGMSH